MDNNTSKMIESSKAILKVLSDEKWHKYSELLEKTKLSSRTLTKRLDNLLEGKLIQKEKREYPSAYFKAEPEAIDLINATSSKEELLSNMEGVLLEVKNPIFLLELINIYNTLSISYDLIEELQNNKISDERLYFLMEIWVWEPFRELSWKLLEVSKKHRDIIDVKKIKEYQLEKTLEFGKRMIKLVGEI